MDDELRGHKFIGSISQISSHSALQFGRLVLIKMHKIRARAITVDTFNEIVFYLYNCG